MRLRSVVALVVFMGICLLLPYVLWVSFAAALNLAIWNLNR